MCYNWISAIIIVATIDIIVLPGLQKQFIAAKAILLKEYLKKKWSKNKKKLGIKEETADDILLGSMESSMPEIQCILSEFPTQELNSPLKKKKGKTSKKLRGALCFLFSIKRILNNLSTIACSKQVRNFLANLIS